MSRLFRELRIGEVEGAVALIQRFLPHATNILEVGAGRGWQAKALSEAGYHVDAIDLPPTSPISGHALAREWPIRDYDGVHIPFPDNAFDVVYSSNVLEHVEQLEALTGDMKRVLRPGGIAVHLIPNPQWRLLSLLTYYPGQAVDVMRYIARRVGGRDTGAVRPATMGKAQSLRSKIMRRLIPPTHGSTGTALSEIGRYSKRSWDRFFDRAGWATLHYGNNGVIASGDYLLGVVLPMKFRRKIGRATGGIAHVYVLQPKAER